MDLIDICYGPNSSIYDVLQINQDASPKDIQSAFMARRLELYHKMQSIDNNEKNSQRLIQGPNGENILISERDFIEKKMDVLAAAFKVLREPRKRRKYDAKFKKIASTKKVGKEESQQGKVGRGGSPTSIMENPAIDQSLTNDLDGIQLSKSTSDGDEAKGEMEFVTPVKTEKKKSLKLKDSPHFPSSASVSSKTKSVKSSKSSKSIKSKKAEDKKVPLKSEPSLEEREEFDCDSAIENYYRDQDVVQTRETGLGSWLRRNKYKNQADTVDSVATEIKGSVADICLSFSQVFTAFSIDEGAIDAMAKNIGDTSKQLEAGRYR